MGFEKTVLNMITPLLGGGDAYFLDDGTLILENVDDVHGMSIFRKLDGADLGHINFNINNNINGFLINFV